MNDKIPQIRDDFQIEEIDGETLLYSPRSARSLYLNPTASAIWRLCDGNNSIGEIIAVLSELYPDSADSIEQDVHQSIESFISNKAIELR